jgi:hypothetical protein
VTEGPNSNISARFWIPALAGTISAIFGALVAVIGTAGPRYETEGAHEQYVLRVEDDFKAIEAQLTEVKARLSAIETQLGQLGQRGRH